MDTEAIRRDFPTIRDGRGIYLDSACQTLRPDCVIDAVTEYYTRYPACGGRSVHSMATQVSMGIDESRETLAHFFGVKDPDCFVFTKNCTEGMNTVARGFGLRKGDVVVTGGIEHNSNHVEWLFMENDVGIRRRTAGVDPQGRFDFDSFQSCLSKDVKLVSVGHVSNITGYTVPLKDIVQEAHDRGIPVLADGAQAAPHLKVNLKDLEVDFYCASLHKMLAPTGVGFMYGRKEMLEDLKPLMYGGGTVGVTTYDSVQMASPPDRFEAGLSNYAGIIGVKAALEYLAKIGMDAVAEHDRHLQKVLSKEVEDIPGLSIIGPEDPDERGGVFSFNIKGLTSHDIAMMADSMAGIMIRSGMHCAHPYLISKGIDGSARASFYIYNDDDEMRKLAECLRKMAAAFA